MGARLDRVMCTPECIDKFPQMVIKHLPMFRSDHSPILVQLNGEVRRKQKGFKFQAAWVGHKGFSNMVEDSWRQDVSFMGNVESTARALDKWNQEVFGNIFHRKKKLMARLSGIQSALVRNPHNGLLTLRRKLQHELEATLYQEELLWFQRSREKWICSGDRNTKYYHIATNIKRRQRTVRQLRESDGEWAQDEERIKSIVLEYFTDIFTENGDGSVLGDTLSRFPTLDEEVWERVNAEFTEEDIKRALFDMTPLKASGPDGFHASFFQKQWGTVGGSIVRMVKEFMHTGVLPTGLNDTHIALIPKVKNPERANQFRPISLCNVSYKIITKAMANRIKEVMRGLIGPEQSSFVPDRQITDNIMIYQEVMHTFHKKTGQSGLMAIKIDLEKAYDRLSWGFIRNTLKLAGFNEGWVRNIMECVTTPRLKIVWNGDTLDWITPTRGI